MAIYTIILWNTICFKIVTKNLVPSSLEFWPQEVLVRHVNIFFWACAAHRNKKLGHKRSGAVIIFPGHMMPTVEKSLGDRNLSRRAIKKKSLGAKKGRR